MAADMMMTAFWDVAKRNIVETARRFRVVYCFHHQSDDDGAAGLNT
jgi:hypothetical protein